MLSIETYMNSQHGVCIYGSIKIVFSMVFHRIEIYKIQHSNIVTIDGDKVNVKIHFISMKVH